MIVYSPEDCVAANKTAGQTQSKYDVLGIKHHMIQDFKECASSVVSNRRKDVNEETVQCNKIHLFQYRKACHYTIFFKYNFNEVYK